MPANLKYLLHIFFLLLACTAVGQNCDFRAVQQGQEVQVICAGIPVFFEDCNAEPGSGSYTYYDPGPEPFNPQNFNINDLIRQGPDGRFQYTYTQPGRYTVTQIINRGGGEATRIETRVFEVVATPVPTFSVQVCASGSVQVTIDDRGYDSYDLDYGDNTRQTGLQAGEQAPYTYRSGGTYTLTVTGRYTGAACAVPATQSVTLLPDPAVPLLSRLEVLEQTAAGEVSLTLNNPTPGYRYVTERYNAATARYETVFTTPTLTDSRPYIFRVTGINTNEASLYRLRPTDECGTALTIFSAPVSSIPLQVQPGNESATLNWATAQGNLQSVTINRNGTAIASPTQTSYTDTGLSCGEQYCYQLTGIANNGQSVSLSQSKCITANSTATPPAGLLLSTYNTQNQVELQLLVPQGQAARQVRFERRLDSNPFAPLATESAPTYTDALQLLRLACYRAVYTNPCGQASTASETSCPVYLTGQLQEQNGTLLLGWTGYVGFPDGVGSYTVEVFDATGQPLSTYSATGNTYLERNLPGDVQVLRYRIKAVSGSGAYTSYSNTLEVEQPLQVHIPTGFTPNGDGLNDVLEVKVRFISSFNIKVYNSMGQVVFSSDSLQNSWDGTYQGKPMPAGAYAYDVQVTAPSGKTQRRTGTVTLLR